ncbi:hypothetical protein RND81_05G068100 [Saponaria officinalis]|uniref:Fe2OG dioxygenase domain-containing protein n=1 Tax=Saponaria officinalis TaxID=3572 RepID=A0AAW1KVG2_SAPOF
MVSPSGERLAELKAFDETKTGVKGLVDAGVTTIPSIFIHNFDESPPSKTKTTTISVPTIDFAGFETDPERRADTVKQVQDAIQTWGFFQVVNHGIPLSVLEDMLDGVRRFFEQDDDVKKGYYSRDYSGTNLKYNCNFDLFSGKSTSWRDSFSCFMAPTPPQPEDLPTVCREILMEYSNEVMKLGKAIFELFSEALGLKPSYLNDIQCTEGLQVIGHYYPACPQPELTMGTPQHADNDFLTILLQDHIGGLQVLHDGEWFDVPPTPGALVVNVGDLVQLITNDKFKSVEQRVLANTEGPRISVASFFTTGMQPTDKVYGPIKELLSDSNPATYRETTVKDFTTFFLNEGLDGTSTLQHYML